MWKKKSLQRLKNNFCLFVLFYGFSSIIYLVHSYYQTFPKSSKILINLSHVLTLKTMTAVAENWYVYWHTSSTAGKILINLHHVFTFETASPGTDWHQLGCLLVRLISQWANTRIPQTLFTFSASQHPWVIMSPEMHWKTTWFLSCKSGSLQGQ